MPYLKNSSGDKGGCIFCIKRDTDNDAAEHILHRSETCFVTLNLYPYNNGHLMVVPYKHESALDVLPADVVMDLMVTTQKAIRLLREAYNPQAFNIGINQGAAAGAGFGDHLHQHIVPRWQGDTNYMTVVGQTRVIPEWVDDTYTELFTLWQRLF